MSENILLKAIVESFMDGILILSDRGEVISSNSLARQICQKLNPGGLPPNRVPPAVWRVCLSMVQNRALHQEDAVMIDDQIQALDSSPVRIRVQWMKLASLGQPCLLVTLEDRLMLAQKRAIAERERCGLTCREAEVWLLRQVDCTYEAIARKLHITVDTVKKHMRNIHAKQEAFQWAQD